MNLYVSVFVKFVRKKGGSAKIWKKGGRYGPSSCWPPELLIPAKNDKAEKFAAEQGESYRSCKNGNISQNISF